MFEKQVFLFGVNHKTTPVAVREKIAFTDGYETALTRLQEEVGCDESYLLSTCNRVEILVYADSTRDIEAEVSRFLFAGKVPEEDCRDYLYALKGLPAVQHLFTVAASLDSMVVGEAQILGQLKTAYRHASALGCTGPLLNRLLHKSFSVAKRVRTETAIGASAVSISYAAVQLARKIFGNLDTKKVMLVGAGEMAELAAEHLVGQGVSSVVVANRTLTRAVELADKFGGTAICMEELYAQLEDVDIIISSTGAQHIIIESAEVRPIMRVRRNRPLFFIDIAVPRDLDPELNELENVYLYDIDDLSNVVEVNKSGRDHEAIKAGCIVEEETRKFDEWYQGLAVKPTVLALREKMSGIIEQELRKTLPRLHDLGEHDQRSIEKMVASISSKFLHDPLHYLKSDSCHGRDKSQAKVDTLRSVFSLKGDI
ncbi:glutamyl-tRNA reductase [Desulfotalea psychrophila]|uniref:Glutamyl-tRNA reductase n=1 Tax=Desulfotalea psychrophila (strain LSv54 / DSM 12343) TaxID=177439 RepID=HEM1_DESPS|nr:glutamyl-tRNA reductase [Desulfotalea psychrophila]Q6AIM2.1 RecName: Full=Glutamyl-tRNA reductase; Short=GluTR [Desulfotalea psychrophila LSv54]CAG37808.1 related to glutamyl-tRNA reductase [Desulfotalea psychrophila LSv54]